MDPSAPRDDEMKGVHSDSFAEKLGKKPVLLVILAALITLLISAIPFQTLFGMISRASGQISIADTSKSFKPWASTPLLFVVVCLVILLILFSSHSESGGLKSGFMADDHKFETKHSSQGISSKKSSEPTSLMESIFLDHCIPSDDHIEEVTRATALDDDQQGEVQESFTNWQDKNMEDGLDSSSVQAKEESSTSGGLGNVRKLSRPVTSTSLLGRDHIPIAADSKLPSSSCSFKEDASQDEKDELNEKFDSFLENFKHQLRLQKLESIRRRQNNLNSIGEEKAEKNFEENLHPLDNDIFEDEDEDEGIEDLSVDELKERIGKFVSSFPDTSESQQQEAYPSGQKSFPSENDHKPLAPESSSADTTKPSSQLTRKDSLATDNQKFNNFLQNFKDEQKMQKMRSILRRQGK